jgi:hypothetical protein
MEKIGNSLSQQPMAIRYLGDTFEKNQPFAWSVYHKYYALVQDGKVIGTTDAKPLGKKEAPVLLNKKFFKNLKCGLFSKKVKVEIYQISDHISYKSPAASGDLTVRYSSGNVSVDVTLENLITISDFSKIYDKLIEEKGTQYTLQGFKETYCDFVKFALDGICDSIPDGTYRVCNTPATKNAETEKIAAAVIKDLEHSYSLIGYKIKLKPGTR